MRYPLINSLGNNYYKKLEVLNEPINNIKLDAPIYDKVHYLKKFLYWFTQMGELFGYH